MLVPRRTIRSASSSRAACAAGSAVTASSSEKSRLTRLTGDGNLRPLPHPAVAGHRAVRCHEHRSQACLRRARLHLGDGADRARAGSHRQHDGHLQLRPWRVRPARRLHRLPVREQRAVRLGRHSSGARGAGAGRPGAGTAGDPPVLRRAHHRHARHLRHRPGHPRDRARAARRPLQVDLRADRRRDHRVRRRFLGVAHRDRAHHRRVSSPAPGFSSPAPRSACRSAARSRTPTSRAPAGSRPPRSTPSPSPSAPRWPASPAR